MSMLDSFFNKGFKAAKCKTLLKLTIPRIKLLRNRREIQLKQMRREIAKLLETGQEATARIRVEHIIREENMMAAQEIVELFCELISVRLPVIESQRECPLDLKEAISSVCFAAPRCADLPELLHVQILFASKYGKEFLSAATELMPDCGVNRQLIELLSIRPPSPEKKLKLLKEIAEEHEVDWDPAASETEFFKSHEDLLNGPTQFVSGSKLPLPEEKRDEKLHAAPDEHHNEQINSDTDLDELDFPEVPKVSLRPSANTASAPAVAPPLPTVSFSENDQGSSISPGAVDNPSMRRHFESEQEEERPVTSKDENPYASVSESKQFVPFISPPTLSSKSITMKPIERPSYLSSGKGEANVDLQDVLAAAHAAAETAEKAAAAARTAASLAQVRISELTKKNFDQALENSSENPFHKDTCNQSDAREKPYVGYYHSIGSSESDQVLKEGQGSQVSNLPTFDPLKESDIPLPDDSVIESNPDHHRPQRLTSMDDDYFSYPNLFTSQNSDTGSGAQSFIDKPNNNQDH